MTTDPPPAPRSSATDDPLAEIDEILQRRSRSQRQLAEDSAERDTQRVEFLEGSLPEGTMVKVRPVKQ